MSHITKIVDEFRPSLEPYEALYKSLHANPELSFMERETAATIAEHLSKHGDYQIKTNIGGTGVAAVLENGAGPKVLLRADIDGLPVKEQTGLPYASTKRMLDHEGAEQPVMHACGHDMHITSLLAAAELLHAARAAWSGTLILIFQPAEEKGAGAQAMVDDGLYTKHLVPEPDIVLGAHLMPFRAGMVGSRPKEMGPSADALKVELHGRGGHGSQPHRTVDPVTMAAYTVARLQTLVSRETAPNEHAVVTVASIHAGTAENIISSEAELKINVRTFDPKVRERILAGIKRVVQAECDAGNAVAPPTYTTISKYPLTYNDVDLNEALSKNFTAHFGDSHDDYCQQLLGSEDFSILATSIRKPYCYWLYGGTDAELWDRKEREGRTLEDIPINHSPFFYPVIQPTLGFGVDGYAVAALTWLAKS